MSAKKFVGVTALVSAGLVAGAPFYAVGTILADGARFVYRHPRLTVAMALAGGYLWYQSGNGVDFAAEIKKRLTSTVEFVTGRHAKDLESRLNAVSEEQQRTLQTAKEWQTYAKGQEQQKDKYASELTAQQAYAAKMAAEKQQAETDAQRALAQARQAATMVQEQRQYASRLESELSRYRGQGGSRQSPPPAGRKSTPQPETPQVQQFKDPNFYFYFVKQGDYPAQIARNLTGDGTDYVTILADNNIPDAAHMAVGQMIKIRRSLYRTRAPGVFERVSFGKSLALPASMSIRDLVNGDGERLARTLKLNQDLGLEYTADTAGPRVVYTW